MFGRSPGATPDDDITDPSSSFSSVDSLGVTEDSSSESEDQFYSTQTTVDDAACEDETGYEDKFITPHGRFRRARSTSFASSTSSQYSDHLTTADWGDISIAADSIAETCASQIDSAGPPASQPPALGNASPQTSVIEMPHRVKKNVESLSQRLSAAWRKSSAPAYHLQVLY